MRVVRVAVSVGLKPVQFLAEFQTGAHLAIDESWIVMKTLDDPVSQIAGHLLQDK